MAAMHPPERHARDATAGASSSVGTTDATFTHAKPQLKSCAAVRWHMGAFRLLVLVLLPLMAAGRLHAPGEECAPRPWSTAAQAATAPLKRA